MELWTMLFIWIGGFLAGSVAGYLIRAIKEESIDALNQEDLDSDAPRGAKGQGINYKNFFNTEKVSQFVQTNKYQPETLKIKDLACNGRYLVEREAFSGNGNVFRFASLINQCRAVVAQEGRNDLSDGE